MPIFRRPLESRRRAFPFWRIVAPVAVVVLLLLAWSMRGPGANMPDTRVIVLLCDGAGAERIETYLEDGRLPNLARLVASGGYRRLAAPWPADETVGWSNLATGAGPDLHGIWGDVVPRRDRSGEPDLFPTWDLPRGSRFLWDFIPAKAAEYVPRSARPAFWDTAAEARIPTVLLFAPHTFPARQQPESRRLAGPGTPDRLGAPGLFTWLSTDASEISAATEFFAGQTVQLTRENRGIAGVIPGPLSPIVRQRMATVERELELLSEEPTSTRRTLRENALEERRAALVERLRAPIPVVFHPVGRALEVEIGGAEATLPLSAWSSPVAVELSVNSFVSIRGTCRFYVSSLEPETRVYMTPLEAHPYAGRLPVASPGKFAKRMVREVGLYKTRGHPEELAGLASGRLSERAFLSDLESVAESRAQMLSAVLSDRWGLLVASLPDPGVAESVFGDRAGSFTARQDPVHAAYRRLDSFVGTVLDAMDDHTVLFVVSTRALVPFNKDVDLNRWLADQGYLHPAQKAHPARLADLYLGAMHPSLAPGKGAIDWRQTDAWAMGSGAIRLNLVGREAHGRVEPAAAGELLERLVADLADMRDPSSGEAVVSRIIRPASGPAGAGPDLLVGFKRGYRVGERCTYGGMSDAWLTERGPGQTCDSRGADPREVPGVLFCSRPLGAEHPAVTDLAPTVLYLLGVDAANERALLVR